VQSADVIILEKPPVDSQNDFSRMLTAVESRSKLLDFSSYYWSIENPGNFEGIIGSSAALAEIVDLVRIVAPTDSTVLIQGATGTGKELIARAIHNRSRPAIETASTGKEALWRRPVLLSVTPTSSGYHVAKFVSLLFFLSIRLGLTLAFEFNDFFGT